MRLFFQQMSYSDFPIYELFDQHKALSPELFDGLDNLKVNILYCSMML